MEILVYLMRGKQEVITIGQETEKLMWEKRLWTFKIMIRLLCERLNKLQDGRLFMEKRATGLNYLSQTSSINKKHVRHKTEPGELH